MANNPIRIQRKRTKGWKMPENTVYVGRGSKWGNPYVIGKTIHQCDGSGDHRIVTRTLAIRKWVAKMFPYSHRTGRLEDLLVSEANITWIKSELRGKNLACWCDPKEPCHGDMLLEIANGEPDDQ